MALGALLGLYGLFAIVYNGDSRGGDTYVIWAGHQVDADLAGGIALGVGVVLLVAAIVLLKRRRGLSNAS